MKYLLTFVVVLGLMLCASVSNGQTKPPAEPSENPRVSKGPTYVKDTVGAHNKSVNANDTSTSVKVDPNQPIHGGVLSLGGLLCFPQGELATLTNDAVGYGFDFTLLFNMAGKRSRAEWESRWVNVYAGGNCQFMRLQTKEDSYTIDEKYSSTEVTSKVKNNITSFGVLGRVEFFPGKLKLFIEGGGGTRVFTGKHTFKIENTPKGSSNPDDVYTKEDNTTLRTSFLGSYSYGGGLRMSGDVVGVEFKVMAARGTKAEYVDMESITFDRTNESVSYQTQKTGTDMLTFQIAVSGRF